MANNVTPESRAADMDTSGQPADTGAPGQTIEVWEYFAENIDEFATAKTIVDHFVENPGLLDSREVDLHGLFVRAKLTIKRQQIAYAQAQAAITAAREQSRSVRGVVKSFLGFASSLRAAFAANPALIVMVVGLAAVVWMR